MNAFQSLFHCETPHGNQLRENQFQRFVLRKDSQDDLHRIEPSELAQIVTQAKDELWNNSAVVLGLVKILVTSLDPRAYELFIREIGEGVARFIFYEVSEEKSKFPDYDKIRKTNYQKYRLYKFASFLDVLRPGYIYWRGQVDHYSMEWTETGLRRFQAAADDHERTAILQRWIKRPGQSAFSEKRAKRSKEIQRRHEFLLTLPSHLAPAIVANRLDNARFKPGRKYPSYMAWQRQNPKSFASWLSRQYVEAENSLGKSAQSNKH